LNNAKAIASHPEQEALLSFCADIDAGVEKSPEQSPVSQQNSQEFVVVDIDIVEPSGVKQIVTIDKNRHSATVSELP
jgi:hypothetical protein